MTYFCDLFLAQPLSFINIYPSLVLDLNSIYIYIYIPIATYTDIEPHSHSHSQKYTRKCVLKGGGGCCKSDEVVCVYPVCVPHVRVHVRVRRFLQGKGVGRSQGQA